MRILIILSLLLPPLTSEATETYCEHELFTSQTTSVKQAKVTATENGKLHFRNGGEGCPDSAKCVQKAYLVAGDKLIVTNSINDWTCSLFLGKKQSFFGWLPTKFLEISPVESAPQLADWAGDWRTVYPVDWLNDNHGGIKITLKEGHLEVSGETVGDCKERPGGYYCNEGGFAGEAVPVGDLLIISDSYEGDPLTISDDACAVQIRLIPNCLIVTDNWRCGGHNVSFTGVYGVCR
ncbi:MAG: hypothetical protein LBE22_07050 [Azoarcus sp.]|jgi:hypothetical protein|nr:hypothetical protein [Azoarcus sp.]